MVAMANTRRKRRSEAGRSGGIFVLSEDVTGTPVYTYHPDYYSISVASSCSFDTVNTITVPIFVDENSILPSVKVTSWNGTSDYETEKPHEAVSGSSPSNCASTCMAGLPVLESISGNKQFCHHRDRIAEPAWFNPASKITQKAANVFQYTKARWSTIRPGEPHFEHAKTVGNIHRMDTATKEVGSRIVAFAEPDLHLSESVYVRHGLNTPEFGYGYFSTVEEYLQAEAAMRSFWPDTDLNEVENVEAEAPREDINTPTLAAAHETPKRDLRTHYEVLGLFPNCHDKE